MKSAYNDLKVSELLQKIVDEQTRHHNLTLGKFVEMLHSRSYGIAILVLALPSTLPLSVIPGISVFFGIPILLLSAQVALSMPKLWLPKWLSSKKLGNKKFFTFLNQAINYIKKAEKYIRPRYAWITHAYFKPFSGVLLMLLSFLLMLPIPFSNMLFGSLIALIALGLIERDGLLLLIATGLSCITVSFFYQALFAIFRMILFGKS